MKTLILLPLLALACSKSAIKSSHDASIPDQWEELYAGASLEDLRLERSTLQDILALDAKPYYDIMFGNGSFSVVGKYAPGIPFSVDASPSELSEFRFLPDGQVGKVVLPEAEFPSQYMMKRQIEWLIAREASLQAVEYGIGAIGFNGGPAGDQKRNGL